MKVISSGEIRSIILFHTLSRLLALKEYDSNAVRDMYTSLMFLGKPGVGKSVLQYLGLIDVRDTLRSLYKSDGIDVKRVELGISIDEVKRITDGVIRGNYIPYGHLYLSQTRVWHLEGTPSPQDNFVEISGFSIPFSLWRYNPFIIPFLDFTSKARVLNPSLLVLDEFNMARRDVVATLFQLTRSAEMSVARLSPLTVISLVGNTEETNIYVEEMPSPLINRAMKYRVDNPTLDGWLAFMNEVYGIKWDKTVGGFLLTNPSLLYTEREGDPYSLITPRTWTQLATGLYLSEKLRRKGIINERQYEKNVQLQTYGLLGDIASKFLPFYSVVKRVNLNEILSDPSKILGYDREVMAYLLVSIVSIYRNMYYKERNSRKRAEILEKIATAGKTASKKLGSEAVSLVLGGLPVPLQIKVASLMKNDLGRLKDVSRQVRAMEEMLS